MLPLARKSYFFLLDTFPKDLAKMILSYHCAPKKRHYFYQLTTSIEYLDWESFLWALSKAQLYKNKYPRLFKKPILLEKIASSGMFSFFPLAIKNKYFNSNDINLAMYTLLKKWPLYETQHVLCDIIKLAQNEQEKIFKETDCMTTLADPVMINLKYVFLGACAGGKMGLVYREIDHNVESIPEGIQAAAEGGHYQIIQFLYHYSKEHRKMIINRNPRSIPPLPLEETEIYKQILKGACVAGKHRVVKKLLTLEDISVIDSLFETIKKKADFKMLRLLLKKSSYNSYFSQQHYSQKLLLVDSYKKRIKKDQEFMTKYLQDHIPNWQEDIAEILTTAISDGVLPFLEKYLPFVNETDFNSCFSTWLLEASRNDHLAIVRHLLEYYESHPITLNNIPRYDHFFQNAAQNNNREMMELFVPYLILNEDLFLDLAIFSDKNILLSWKPYFELTEHVWNKVLLKATEWDQVGIIELCAEKGATVWNLALLDYCKNMGCHMGTFMALVRNGASNFGECLEICECGEKADLLVQLIRKRKSNS